MQLTLIGKPTTTNFFIVNNKYLPKFLLLEYDNSNAA